MGKHFNAEVYRQIAPQLDDEVDENADYSPTEADFEESYSDWKWNKDDDLATAVRRYAMPNCHVSLMDEMGVGR